MTTKILTVRIPAPLYSAICTSAAEQGVPIAVHVRRLIEQQQQATQIEQLRYELLNKFDRLAPTTLIASQEMMETLLLARAIAAHLNPQLVSHVRAKIAAQL